MVEGDLVAVEAGKAALQRKHSELQWHSSLSQIGLRKEVGSSQNRARSCFLLLLLLQRERERERGREREIFNHTKLIAIYEK